MEKLIVTLMNARTVFHLLHLRTKSLAKHLALSELYDNLNESIDMLAEQYQGSGEAVLLEIDAVPALSGILAYEPLAAVEELLTAVEGMRGNLGTDDPSLLSTFEETVRLIQRGRYKLKHLNQL
jgi:DNA-binding ferritin-like protein